MMAASIHAWVEALEEAALEVVELALGLPGCAFVAKKVAAPRNVAGAYLPLFGGAGESLYVGWLVSAEASHALAGGLLGIGAGETLADEVVADAMGEVVNILAGGLKRRMLPLVHPLSLGLPIFSSVPIAPVHAETYACQIRSGGVDSHLVLVHAGGNGAPGSQ